MKLIVKIIFGILVATALCCSLKAAAPTQHPQAELELVRFLEAEADAEEPIDNTKSHQLTNGMSHLDLDPATLDLDPATTATVVEDQKIAAAQDLDSDTEEERNFKKPLASSKPTSADRRELALAEKMFAAAHGIKLAPSKVKKSKKKDRQPLAPIIRNDLNAKAMTEKTFTIPGPSDQVIADFFKAVRNVCESKSTDYSKIDYFFTNFRLDVNIKEKNHAHQNTALHLAAFHGHEGLVAHLLSKDDIDVRITNGGNITARQMVSEHSIIGKMIDVNVHAQQVNNCCVQ